MPTRKQFKFDLKRSQPLVDFTKAWFKAKGFRTSQTKGKMLYDLRATKVDSRKLTDFRVECKYDQRSLETQNICLEKHSLDYSTADIFIIGMPEKAYVLTLDQARWLYSNADVKRCVGDIPNNLAAIIPKSFVESLKAPVIGSREHLAA